MHEGPHQSNTSQGSLSAMVSPEMQIKRIHQTDSSTAATGVEARNKMSTTHWTLSSLVKIAIVTLACGFVAGEDRTACCCERYSSQLTVLAGLKLVLCKTVPN